eukprot:9495713-Pyramimonas_sp.AAC.2
MVTNQDISLVEALQEESSGVPPQLLKGLRGPATGQATVMLSYTWSLPLAKLLSAAQSYSKKSGVFFWIDAFTVRPVRTR